jgi:ABC-type nitrate/sulfonate/bicarbonate transport system substrate-binding protein
MSVISKPLSGLAMAAVVSLVLAGCSGGASPSAPQSAVPTGASGSDAPSAIASTAAGALPTPEVTHLRIGAGITEMGQYPGILAAQAGIYEKHGITVEYSVFEGDTRVALALQAGQIDLALASVSAALNSQLTDVPFDVMGVFALRSSDDLVCQSGIDTADKVRGKKIAISGFGGTSNGAALLLLKELKLSPIDAAITSVGGQSVRLAALKAGSVDCAVIDLNIRADMQALGFSIAASLEKSTQQYGASGFEMTKEFIKTNPNTALVVAASILEAQNSIWLDPAAAVPFYAQFSGLDNEAATAQVNDWLTLGNRTLMWSDEALRNPQKTIAVVNPDIIDIAVADAGNRTLLQTLADNGFYTKIGNPLP